MISIKQKYTIDDLHKDMRVRVSQLSGILDTCMILVDTELLADNDVEGTLVYFGSGNTEEYTKWFQQEKAITPVFFESAELEDGVVYDEEIKESLSRTPGPIMPSQIPKVKLDMRGLVKYAKERGVAPIDLTREEKERFMLHLAVLEERRTLGIANGKYFISDDIDECNDEIVEMFGVKES